VGPHITPEKRLMDAQNYKKNCAQKFFIFVKLFIYTKRRYSLIEPQLKNELEYKIRKV